MFETFNKIVSDSLIISEHVTINYRGRQFCKVVSCKAQIDQIGEHPYLAPQWGKAIVVKNKSLKHVQLANLQKILGQESKV